MFFFLCVCFLVLFVVVEAPNAELDMKSQEYQSSESLPGHEEHAKRQGDAESECSDEGSASSSESGSEPTLPEVGQQYIICQPSIVE